MVLAGRLAVVAVLRLGTDKERGEVQRTDLREEMDLIQVVVAPQQAVVAVAVLLERLQARPRVVQVVLVRHLRFLVRL